MMRGDLPGTPGPWPPPGELAGVGVFSLLLLAGLGVAIWLAGRRTVVLTLSLLLVGAWLMRFWFASQMYATDAVQLYPRTTPQLLYCFLLLVGFAVHFAAQRLRQARTASAPVRPERSAVSTGPVRAAVGSALGPAVARGTAVAGVLAATLMFGLFAGSATADRYMPRDDGLGIFSYRAQLVRQPDGNCPVHSHGECFGTPAEVPDGLVTRDGSPAPSG
jgi:hypothetical protein